MVVEEPPWRKGRHREVVTALTETAAAATTLELVAKSRDCVLMAAETREWAENFESVGRFSIILGRVEMGEFLWNSVDSGRIREPFMDVVPLPPVFSSLKHESASVPG